MRRKLDWIYSASGALAALFLAGIAVLVLGQIIGRFMGFSIPSATEISGYFVAASASLGLAPTMQKAGHVRVSLLLERLHPAARMWVEVWCLSVSLGVMVHFTRWSVDLVLGSVRFNDVSAGILPIPLWIPQGAMTLGLILFCICLADNLWMALMQGKDPAYRAAEATDLQGEI